MYHTIVYLYKNLIKQLKRFQTGSPLGHPVYKPECVVKIYTSSSMHSCKYYLIIYRNFSKSLSWAYCTKYRKLPTPSMSFTKISKAQKVDPLSSYNPSEKKKKTKKKTLQPCIWPIAKSAPLISALAENLEGFKSTNHYWYCWM